MELIISLDDRNFEYSAKQESKIGLFKGYKKTIENILKGKFFRKNKTKVWKQNKSIFNIAYDF